LSSFPSKALKVISVQQFLALRNREVSGQNTDLSQDKGRSPGGGCFATSYGLSCPMARSGRRPSAPHARAIPIAEATIFVPNGIKARNADTGISSFVIDGP
jgi:hypothetical protein